MSSRPALPTSAPTPRDATPPGPARSRRPGPSALCYARARGEAMTIADRYGLPLSTSSPLAAQRYQDGMDRQLSYGPAADEGFSGAIAADPEFAMPQAGMALLALFRGDGAGARTAIGRARELAAGATRRERQHVEALATLVAGETGRGLAMVDEHVAEFPRDALLVNQASSTIGFGGRPDRET